MGSKPSKLLKNRSLSEIKNIYKLSDEKLELLKKVDENQEKLNISPDDISLYINIPFCPTRCDYCSYPTLIGAHHDKGAYVDYLIREIDGINLPEKLDAIYIGGGTPSYLTGSQIEKILACINKKFTYKEFTFEAGREDTLDKEKLHILKAGGVSRISLNPQTFNRKILENESADDFAKNFDILKNLLQDNITFHALAIKSGSKYNEASEPIQEGGFHKNSERY